MDFRTTLIGVAYLCIFFVGREGICANEKLVNPEVQIQKMTEEIRHLKSAMDQQTKILEGYRNDLTDEKRVKNSFWTVYVVPLLAPLAALIAAIGGWFITFKLLIRGFQQQESVRAEEQKRQDTIRSENQRHANGARIESFLVDSLKYFDGGIQERSIGLGFVEAYWADFSRLQAVWTSVLVNQAIFILSKIVKDSQIPTHEADNLRRIKVLLEKASLTSHQANNLAAAARSVSASSLGEEFADIVKSLAEWGPTKAAA